MHANSRVTAAQPLRYIGRKARFDGGIAMTAVIDAPGSKHNITGARQAYYDKAAKFHMAPLWEVLKGLVTPEPKTQCVPAIWKFADVKRLMLEAGEVITAEEAERRVLVLENPGRDRQVAHHQFAVRRHPAHLAGRGRRRASARRLRHPLRAGRRGRLYRGRGREDADEARRLHHHRQLGAARSRQSRQAAGDVARRARPADGQSFRDVVRLRISTRRCRTPITPTATRSTATPPACCRTARRSASTARR